MGDLRRHLKAAVEATPVPPGLETRIVARVRTAGPRRRTLLPALGVLVTAALLLTVYEKGYLPVSVGSQADYIAAVSASVATVMKVGLGDHIHCAVFRKYPKNPPAPAEFVETIGPKYSGLVEIVQRNTPPGYRMLLAHQCHYLGRKFIHLTLGDGDHLLSLVITAREEGESLKGNPFTAAAADKFQISAFESSGYLVYFVSDLPGGKNAELLTAMAPAVRALLAKA